MTHDDGLLGVPFIGGMAGFVALILSGSWVAAIASGIAVATVVGVVLHMLQRLDSAGAGSGGRTSALRPQPPNLPRPPK